MFILFLENSFKYGLSSCIDEGFVNIVLNVDENNVYFYIENSKLDVLFSWDFSCFSGGIGLVNIYWCFKFLYLDYYELDIEDSFNIYVVNFMFDIEF